MRHLFLTPVCLATFTTLSAAPLATLHEAIERGYHSSDPLELRQAASVIETELKQHPEKDDLRRTLAILLLDRLYDPARAIPYLERIVELSPEEGAWQHSLARALRQARRTDRAAVHFYKAAELQPKDAWVRYELGNTLSESGRFTEAVQAYRAALSLEGKNTDTRLALARTLWAAGEESEANAEARKILEYDPLHSAARKLLLADRTPAAPAPAPTPVPVPVAPTPPSKPIDPVDTAVARAYSSGLRRDFERAADQLEAAVRRKPSDLARRKTLAFLYADKLHSPSRAIPHFKEVVELAPRDAAWWGLLAKTQAGAGDAAGAVESYRRAADLAPRDIWVRYHLARLLREAGRKPEAESAFREALKIDPRNRYVRRELAQCAYESGKKNEAAALARELVAEDATDADAHALLGDVERSQLNFAAAGQQYQAALATNPSHATALSGIQELRRAQRPEVKLAYYTFDDTDGLRQSGVFSYVGALLTGQLKASAFVNKRFFEQDELPAVERWEMGLGADYRLSSTLQLAAGISQFKAEDHHAKWGGNVALYYQPVKFADGWVSYRSSEPVNDSYTTAQLAFTQSILAAGLNLRPIKQISISATASRGEYTDDNIRRSALASVSWYVPVPTSPILRLEYEWLDYERRTSAYSSPDNYTRFRPLLEWSPRLTDWMKIELLGELSYVFDEEQWGSGFTAGIRFNKQEDFNLGVSYMEYEIPGGQTTWSGSGFKVDLTGKF